MQSYKDLWIWQESKNGKYKEDISKYGNESE